MSVALRIGMGDHYGVRVTVPSGDYFNPLEPDGAILKITKPDGSTVDWTAAIEAQTSASVTAYYRFNADGSDLDVDGTWLVWVQWTAADALGARSESGSFSVIAANRL